MIDENSNLFRVIEDLVVTPATLEMQNLPDTDFAYSTEFTSKMQRLVNRRSKIYYPLFKTTFRKTITISIAVMLMGAITVAAVEPIREWFIGLFVTESEDYADVKYVEGDVPTEAQVDDFVCYEPVFIPEGFIVQSEVILDNSYVIIYEYDY